MADLAERPTSAALRSLGALALSAAERHSGDAMRAPGRAPITYADFGRAMCEIAGGLASLGVGPADKVAILCGTVPEWTLADFGAFCAGATVVPVYHTNSPEECEYVLSHSGANVIMVEDAAQAAKIASVRGALPALEHVIVLTGEAEGAITLADLRSRGAADGEAVARERTQAVSPEDTATIVYTSGTTGPPKGCVLSHANLLYTADAYIDRLDLRDSPPVIFQYLPLAHVLARMVSFVALDTGGDAGVLGRRHEERSPPTSPRPSRPTSRPSRGCWRRSTRASSAPPRRRAARRRRSSSARWRPASRWRRPSARAARSSIFDRARHAAGDRLALSKVRDALGPNNPVLVTGAAPIGTEVIEFFYACGVPVLEGYGMTETCAAATLNTVERGAGGQRRAPAAGHPRSRSATTARS